MLQQATDVDGGFANPQSTMVVGPAGSGKTNMIGVTGKANKVQEGREVMFIAFSQAVLDKVRAGGGHLGTLVVVSPITRIKTPNY